MYTQTFTIVVLFVTTATCQIIKFPTDRNGDRFTNMVMKNRNIYVAENGRLHKLDTNLIPIRSVPTCSGPDCENVNKILTAFDDKVIMCGTGNNGTCQAWNESVFVYNSSSVVSDGNYLRVSSDINRPAVGLVFGEHLIVGIAYGAGITLSTIGSSETETYKYLLSRRDISESFTPVAYAYLKNDISEDYLVYFRKVFQYQDFIYFLTTQKLSSTDTQYVSKLIRICVNDTATINQQIKQMNSYTDIVLPCKVDGVDYNLVQDAVFLPVTGILVAAFSKGDDPENPTTDTAICVYTIGDVNNAILQAKEDFITCSTLNLSSTQEIAYLDITLGRCVPKMEFTTLKDEYVCPSPTFQASTKVIGSNSVMLPTAAVYRIDNTNSKITKMAGVERYGQFPDVYVGTNIGVIKKLTIYTVENMTVYIYEDSVPVDRGHVIKDIHVDDDKEYVLSNRKLFKLTTTDCSEYTNCNKTMAAKNPSCGWCVDEDRSTKKPDCTGTSWLSSLTQCISIVVSPKYIPVNNGTTDIHITVSSNFPDSTTQLSCRVLRGGNAVGGYHDANQIGDNFTCNIPELNNHEEYTIELLKRRPNMVTYAATSIQLYECSQFKRCQTCLISPEVKCNWCLTSLKCSSGTCDGNSTQSRDQCPQLEKNTDIYVPNGISKTITLQASNLVSGGTYEVVVHKSDQDYKTRALKLNQTHLQCTIEILYDGNSSKSVLPISVIQKQGLEEAELDQEHTSTVTIYKCEHLGGDCTSCTFLNDSRYDCNWCGQCEHTSVCSTSHPCPSPQITSVDPISGGYKGGTPLTLKGLHLGTEPSSIAGVRVGDLDCNKDFEILKTDDPDFLPYNKEIQCTLGKNDNKSRIGAATVMMMFNGSEITDGPYSYSYQVPLVQEIIPNSVINLGGTNITLKGSNLNIGRKINYVRLGSLPDCTNPQKGVTGITCLTPKIPRPLNITKLTLWIDDEFYESMVAFYFVITPEITSLSSNKSSVSGGKTITFSGTNLQNGHTASITSSYAGHNMSANCTKKSSTELTCNVPPAPENLKSELEENTKDPGTRNESSKLPIDVDVFVNIDGYEKHFKLSYFRDPVFYNFTDAEATRSFTIQDQELIITGQFLDLAAVPDDYTVTLGLNSMCKVTEVNATHLICRPPSTPPASASSDSFPQVEVQLGNFRQTIGFVKYVIINEGGGDILGVLLKIVLPAVGGLILLGVLVGVFGVCKYKRVKGKAKEFEKNLQDMEMQIKQVFREEFLDMHTTMSRVNESLIEKGFPYNSYQRYCFVMMFPGEWDMEEHPLMHEPVVSKRKVSDGVRMRLKKGMDLFEELLLNKFFLVSVISTMEKQRKFFLKEKSNMAGHLSVALLGRMEYLHEILPILLTNLVDNTQSKSQKTLFRRCESISEKLLSNWLVLSLYPHVKIHSGSPLYMLLKGTQLTMESGPIDALTGDSKYTLSEDKLLKQDDKPTNLTIKMMVDNNDEIRDCKVLDCDTISQVKAKCLSQIYVNFPASQLTVDSSELNLEWHWGSGGRLEIKDEDASSKREGDWLQLNTLKHYNVQDGSSMALVDPHGMMEQEDYVNLAHIRLENDPGSNGSIHSNEPLTPFDEEGGLDLTRWHLVKPDAEQQKSGSVVVDELYLNRLITTKVENIVRKEKLFIMSEQFLLFHNVNLSDAVQLLKPSFIVQRVKYIQSILEYMRNLFDTILNNTIPPPAKYLFDFLDDLGEKNKVDPDTVHSWKSQCYTVRFWATLINKPWNLFDQRIPSYVETSMEVISQVLIESCSLKAHQYTKDSSPGKLIFKNDMMVYRDKVKDYYTRVRATSQTPEDLRQYLKDLNRFQHQQTSFNRHAALYSLYTQMKPYMEEIMEALESNEETRSLHLDRKLTDLNKSMSDD